MNWDEAVRLLRAKRLLKKWRDQRVKVGLVTPNAFALILPSDMAALRKDAIEQAAAQYHTEILEALKEEDAPGHLSLFANNGKRL